MMSSGLALALVIMIGCLFAVGLITGFESHPKQARRIKNDINSEMVRRALKRRYK